MRGVLARLMLCLTLALRLDCVLVPVDPLVASLAEADETLHTVLSSYQGYQTRLLELGGNTNSSRPSSSTRGGDKPRPQPRLLVAHVHTNVVFVGFPAAAVSMFHSTWFANLGREDDLLATLGSGRTVRVPLVSVQHHFHLAQISFHVADVLGELLTSLVDHERVNVWEFEEALGELAAVVAANDSNNISATVFVLNLQLPFAYEYAAGLGASSLQLLAQSTDVVELARQVLRSVRRPVRVEEGFGPSSSPLAPEGSLAAAKAALGRWAGGTAHGDSIGGSGSSVHLRDVVKETRQWAKSYGPRIAAAIAGDRRQALENRARRMLAQPGPQRLALARSILSASPRQPLPCSSHSWLGSGRVVWTDLRARHEPSVDSLQGASMHVPAPRAMEEHEWLQLGAANARRDLAQEVKRGRAAVLRHQHAVQGFFAQAHCPPEVLEDALADHAQAHVFAGFVSRVAYDSYPSVGFLRPSCALLAMQVGLLAFAKRRSEALDAAVSAYETQIQSRGEGDPLLVRETREAHLRTLAAVLQASNVLVDTPHALSGLVSHEAAVFLGYLGALLLQTSRFIQSPPLAMHIDTQHPDLPMPRAQPKAAATTGFAIPSKPVTGAAGGRRHLAAITPDVVVLSHAHSGDSILDYVRSADYEAGADGVGEGEGDGGAMGIEAEARRDDELALWSLLWPPLLFPAKIEVKVYLVRGQQRYEPLLTAASEGLESPGGFDYAALMAQLSRLRLPSQGLVVSVETLRPEADPGVALALAACARQAISPASPVAGDEPSSLAPPNGREVSYLDSNCLWSLMQHPDEPAVSTRAGASSRLSKGASKFISTTQTAPVIVLSLDTPTPTFIDAEHQLAASVGHGVVVVQNAQRSVPLGLTCGGQAITVDGRNPVAAAAHQLAQVIAGLPPKSLGHCGSPSAESLLELALPSSLGSAAGSHNVRVDPGLFSGQSPSFAAAALDGLVVFSTIEIEASHRARVLRALGVARALAAVLAGRKASVDRGGFSEWWDDGELVAPQDGLNWGPLTALCSEALEALSRGDWSAAAALSNAAHFLLREAAEGRALPEAFRHLFNFHDGSEDASAGTQDAPKEASESDRLWGDALCLLLAAAVSFLVTRTYALGVVKGLLRGRRWEAELPTTPVVATPPSDRYSEL